MLRIYFISLHLALLLSAGSSSAHDIESYTSKKINYEKFAANPSSFNHTELYKYNFKPKAPCDLELDYNYYQLCYSVEHRISKWAMHELTLAQIKGSQARTNDFKADHRAPNPVHADSYRRSGYDRGHLVPAADMRLNHQAMSETFFMTNMTPQNPGFNSGVWNSLEAHIRKEVERLGPALIITAPILLEQQNYLMLQSGVSIPDEFYKIAYFYADQSMQAFVIPNAHAHGQSYRSFKTTVREIETLTAIDFFSELPDDLENMLETN